MSCSLGAESDLIVEQLSVTGYNSDPLGVGWVIFDTTGPKTSAGSSRIFVGVEVENSPSIWYTEDAGVTCTSRLYHLYSFVDRFPCVGSPLPGQNTTYLTHKAVLSPAEKSLYVTYVDSEYPHKLDQIHSLTRNARPSAAGPFDGSHGWIGKYNITSQTWKNVTPAQAISDSQSAFTAHFPSFAGILILSFQIPMGLEAYPLI